MILRWLVHRAAKAEEVLGGIGAVGEFVLVVKFVVIGMLNTMGLVKWFHMIMGIFLGNQCRLRQALQHTKST